MYHLFLFLFVIFGLTVTEPAVGSSADSQCRHLKKSFSNLNELKEFVIGEASAARSLENESANQTDKLLHTVTLRALKSSSHRFLIEAFTLFKKACSLEDLSDDEIDVLRKSWGLKHSGYSGYHPPVYVESFVRSRNDEIQAFGNFINQVHRQFYQELPLVDLPKVGIEQFVLDSLTPLNPNCDSCREIPGSVATHKEIMDSLREIAKKLGSAGSYRRLSYPQFTWLEAQGYEVPGHGTIRIKIETLLGKKQVVTQTLEMEFNVNRLGVVEKNNPYGLAFENLELKWLSKHERKFLP